MVSPRRLAVSLMSAAFLVANTVPAGAQEGPVVVVTTPVTAVNQVHTTHTVTMTALRADGQPAAGISIRTSVSGTRTFGTACGTGSSGVCTLTYSSPQEGTDTIVSWADADGDGVQDPDEPSSVATKIWVVSLPPEPDPEPLPGDDDDTDGDDDDSDDSDLDGDDSDVSV